MYRIYRAVAVFYVDNAEFHKREGLALLDEYFSCSLPCEKISLQMAALRNTQIQPFCYPGDDLKTNLGIDRLDSDDDDDSSSCSSGESLDYEVFNWWDYIKGHILT